MCVQPIKIYTNSHAVDYRNLHPIKIDVPCGRCYQCRQKNSIQWMVRSYYEAAFTFFKCHGYVLFDTLTYNDDHICKLSEIVPQAFYTAFADTLVFRKSDLTPFFRRLRRKLELLGYDIDGKLRYLYCSEYGDGEKYVDSCGNIRVGTCRPHYHILFFCTCAELPPLVLSQCIAESWNQGMTDGIKPSKCSVCPSVKFCRHRCLYKDKKYVLKERCFRKFTLESVNKILYVQKYISKSSPYDSKYESIAYQLMNVLYGVTWNQSPSHRRLYQRIRSQICVFHEQSQNFGFGVEKNYDNWLFENKKNYINHRLRIVRGNKIQLFELPKFFREKIYMEKVKCFGGNCLKYKNNAVEYINHLYKAQIHRISDDFLSFMSDCGSYNYRKIINYLDGRSYLDLVKYIVVYRGRLGNITGDSIVDYCRSKFSDDGYFTNHHHTLFLYKNCYSFKYLGFPKTEHFFRKNSHLVKGHRLELKERCIFRGRKHVDKLAVNLYDIENLRLINESFSMFRDFDKIIDIFDSWKMQCSFKREAELQNENKLKYKYRKLSIALR